MNWKEKIKQNWLSLHNWVKIIIILVGIVLLFFIALQIPKALDFFGNWIGRILRIQGY